MQFTPLDANAQARLNEFKLWFLRPGGPVDLRDQRVLEFGCGHARLAIEASGYAQYVGVDFVEPFIKLGEERLRQAGLSDRTELIWSDCLLYEGPRESFDVVCSLGMFEFVEAPEATLQKMAYHLAPGGTLFIDAHHSSPLYNWMRRRRHRKIEREGGVPKQLYSGRQVTRLLQDAGLVDVQILMKEWPFLGSLYSRTGWPWVLAGRNRIAPRKALHWLGTDFVAIARKPG